jgi:hypothetical protein
MPEEPRRGRTGDGGDPASGPVEPVDSVSYRVDPRLTAVKVAVAVILGLVALGFRDDRARVAFLGLAALVIAVYAARDLIVPVRLSADRDGVTVVSGYAGHHRLPWHEIQRVRVDQRRRFGTRSNLLEIDTGDQLYLLSSYDLNARPGDAVDVLAGLRPR